MGILDKNTRVIDMILTDCGKELYSKGELEFSYYAFSDGGVDYDPYITNSGSLTPDQLTEEKENQISATIVREAVFGHQGGKNFESKDETNIRNLLFTVPQGQTIVPEMTFTPDLISGSIETKQQKVIERSVTKDKSGVVINILSEVDRGYRKFKSQKLVIDAEIEDFFEKSSRDGFTLRVFESGSSGLSELVYKRDNRNIVSYSNDLQLHKDEEIEKVSKQPKEGLRKLVK